MIKYRKESHYDWLTNIEKEWYENGIFVNDYAVTNLCFYMRWIVEMYREKYGDSKITILEPGCRMGEAGVAVGRLYPPNKVVYQGMEVSAKVLSESRKYHDLCFFGDICFCPEIPNESYDIVFSRTLFGFLRDIPSAVEIMIRLARRMVVIVQPTPVVMGHHHYASMDSLDDIKHIFSRYNHKILPHIPIVSNKGKPIFGEQILIVEK